MPKVTVIIPNYNHAKYLDKRIQSILEQTYQDFEIIYLDDASTDNSNEVFSKFAHHPQIRAIYNEKNSGSPFKQWNKGIRNSTGKYVWIAESDDYADKNFLATLVDRLDKNPSVGLAYCESLIIDADDKIISPFKETLTYCNPKRWENDFINVGKDECEKYLIFENTIPNASAILIRRSIYEQAGYADETMRLCGDWMTWAKILLISDISFVTEPLNYFRRHYATVRKKTTLNGTAFQESYRILSYILSNIDNPRQVDEKVYELLVDKWFNIFFAKDGQIPWSRNYQIYRIATEVDPKINLRIAQNILMRSQRKLQKIFPTLIPN
jgi:glycosyltransferase involved in cell wall biosynthesis